MAAENFAEVIRPLASGAGVRPAIRRVPEAERGCTLVPFLVAVDEFIDQHPELLRRLAQ